MQVVGYESGVGHLRFDPIEGIEGTPEPPALLIAEEGVVAREALSSGADLDYALGERHCAGTHDGEVHEPCDRSSAPYCDRHASDWPCARCTGECDLPTDACEQEHAVYLAAFAPARFKVGVTRLWRLHARLREQGADRAAHLRTVSNGRIARRIEREIASEIADRVRTATKVGALHREVDGAAWRDLLAGRDPIATYDLEYGLDLEERPVAETIATGTVIGSQGRLLVLERAGTTYAVDLRDLLGREVSPGGTDRDVQSSLGAFGG